MSGFTRRWAPLGAALLLLAVPASGSGSERLREVFRGEYVWNVDGHENQLEAVFEPTGDGLWDVEFRFTYARRAGTYPGKAQGSLRDGAIYGEVEDGAGVVRYRFEAKVDGDRLEGKHFDIWTGRKKLTGTLSLRRAEEDG